MDRWVERTIQKRSKGYVQEGLSFTRNSNSSTEVFPNNMLLRDLKEGNNITLRVTVTWVDEDMSPAECAHHENRYQAALDAVNESDELKKLARENVSSPLLSSIEVGGSCKTCGCSGYFQVVCYNCGDKVCLRCYGRTKWDEGAASCSRCFPLVKEVVLKHFKKNGIPEWAEEGNY